MLGKRKNDTIIEHQVYKHFKEDDSDKGIQVRNKVVHSDNRSSMDVHWNRNTKEDLPINRVDIWKEANDQFVIRIGFC